MVGLARCRGDGCNAVVGPGHVSMFDGWDKRQSEFCSACWSVIVAKDAAEAAAAAKFAQEHPEGEVHSQWTPSQDELRRDLEKQEREKQERQEREERERRKEKK